MGGRDQGKEEGVSGASLSRFPKSALAAEQMARQKNALLGKDRTSRAKGDARPRRIAGEANMKKP